MTRTTLIATALALAVTLPTVSAQAQSPRTFVSAAGSDSNNCANVATPCRHFAAAFAATAADGEIYVLDPANYGSLTITHGISIEGHGWASIAPPSGGNAITINANSGDKINIVGVVLDGAALANTTGIVFNSGGSLTVQDSIIRNFGGSGIALAPMVFADIAVSHTLVADNGGHGIYIQPGSGNAGVNAVFDRVQALRNALRGIGIFANTTPASFINAIAVDSVAAYNQTGFYALGAGTNGLAQFRVFRSTTFDNGVGILGESGALIIVSQSNLESDVWSVNTGGKMYSYGDNYTNGLPVPTSTVGKN